MEAFFKKNFQKKLYVDLNNEKQQNNKTTLRS
jgi:hypothetical protein